MQQYEERHLVIYSLDKVTKAEMFDYLDSIGLAANIIHPTGNGALIVKIPESRQNLIEIIRSHFKDNISINPDPLPSI